MFLNLHHFERETCILMEQFGKYMVFGIQLHEIWKLIFNVKNYIFFMHSELVAYFCVKIIFRFSDIPKLSFLFFFFFLLYPPSASPSLPSEIGWHFADVITNRHSHFSSVGNLLLSPFPSLFLSLFHSLLTSPKEKKAVAMVENRGRREEGAAGCHWRWQPVTLAVINNGGGGST